MANTEHVSWTTDPGGGVIEIVDTVNVAVIHVP